MKKISLNILVVTIFLNILFSIQSVAASKPPAPKGSGGFDGGVVVGGSIDGYIIYTLLISVLFGIWILYKKVKEDFAVTR